MMKNLLKLRFTAILLFCVLLSSNDIFAQVSITGFTPTTITTGTKSVLTINGSGFGTGGPSETMYVEFRNTNDGGATFIKPIASEYVSWTDNQIVVQVPGDPNAGGARTGVIKCQVSPRLKRGCWVKQSCFVLNLISAEPRQH